MVRNPLLAALWVVVLGSATAADPPAAPPTDPATVLRTLTERAAAGSKDRHRAVWQSVLLVARPDLEAGRNRAFWASFVDRDRVRIVPLDEPVPVTIGDRATPRDLYLDRWVVVTPGAAVLVAAPASRVPVDTLRDVHELLTRQAAERPGDTPEVKKQKEAQRSELKAVGPENCGKLVVPILTFRGGADPTTAQVVADARLKLTVRGKVLRAELPSETALAARLAKPLGLPELPRVAVALDWSEQLADEQNRAWLTAALNTALADLTEDDLLEGGVHLQTPDKAVLWTLRDIRRAGAVPPGTATPHKNGTLPCLEAAVRRAGGARGPAKLIFLTWNPGTSIPKADKGYADPFGAPGLSTDANKVELELVQVLGDRLECFNAIRKGHYYVCEDDDRPNGRRVANQLRQLLDQ